MGPSSKISGFEPALFFVSDGFTPDEYIFIFTSPFPGFGSANSPVSNTFSAVPKFLYQAANI